MKRSVLSICFLLALSLSSLCLLSSKISPVYAYIDEHFINGDFETGDFTGWNESASPPTYFSINSENQRTGSYCAEGYNHSESLEYLGDIYQNFSIPIRSSSVLSFGFWMYSPDPVPDVPSMWVGIGIEGKDTIAFDFYVNDTYQYYNLTDLIIGNDTDYYSYIWLSWANPNPLGQIYIDDFSLTTETYATSTGLNTFWEYGYSRDEINSVPLFYVSNLSIPDNDPMQIVRIINTNLTNLNFEAFLFKNSSGLYIHAENGDDSGTALIYMEMWTTIYYSVYKVGSIGDYDLTVECSTTIIDNSSIPLFSYVIPHYVSGSEFVFQEMGSWVSTATSSGIFWDEVTFYLSGGMEETIDDFEGSYYPIGWNTTGKVILTEEESFSPSHSVFIDSSSISLDIQGDPELNYDFLMNGSAYTTPYSNSLFTSGNITLENSSPSLTIGHFIYTFSYWSINATDNLTSSSFTVDIEGDTMISLVFSKAIMDIAFDPRNIASETVHLADTGSQLGRMLGVNSFIGGLIMSAIICGIFLFPVMIFKRTLLPMAIMGFLGLAISTSLGFLPFWIDLVLLLIISVLFSGKIRDFITGAGN